jgi:hypothetical protein
MIAVSTVGTQDNIIIFLYNYEEGQFSKQSTNPISVGGRITNVIANDFNQDNKVDLLITYYNSELVINITSLFVQNSDSDYLFTIHNGLILPRTLQETSMLLGDFNGDTM